MPPTHPIHACLASVHATNSVLGGLCSVCVSMTKYEYKVVPAPRQSDRIKGLTKEDDAYSLTLASVMNDHARGGWEYVRKERLPCQKRSWFMKRSTEDRDLLVFRRQIPGQSTATTVSSEELARVRARRVRKKELVDMVQAGGRRITFGEEAAEGQSTSSPSSVAASAAG